MNWNRKELKKNGKAAMKRSYWPCVLVSFILFAIAAAELKGVSGSNGTDLVESLKNLQLQSGLNPAMFAGVAGGASLLAIVIIVLVEVFVKNMLRVGGARFFINNSRNAEGKLSDVIAPYSEGNFGKIFVTMFLQDLFIALWSLLLVVPGIMKAYSYRMAANILADHPELEPMEVLHRSEEMMRGQRWKAFVLDLSFLGWEILDIFTFGLLDILYVNPYKEATEAELYNALCA